MTRVIVSVESSQRQCATSALLVRPAAFGYNEQTAPSNSLQHLPRETASEILRLAQQEFDAVVRSLQAADIATAIVEDCAPPVRPDAVFPNNWVSFHGDGTVVLYPMEAPNRRLEYREDAIEIARRQLGFHERRRIDLRQHAQLHRSLEGTGSMVLDHLDRVAYACTSPRTHPEVLQTWATHMDFDTVLFDAFDRAGKPLYHTNVMMCIGESFAVVSTEAIAAQARSRVLDRLQRTGREIVEIGIADVEGFAGNMLEMRSTGVEHEKVLVMSTSAARALGEARLAQLRSLTDRICVVSIPTIERYGGGGVRCMICGVP